MPASRYFMRADNAALSFLICRNFNESVRHLADVFIWVLCRLRITNPNVSIDNAA